MCDSGNEFALDDIIMEQKNGGNVKRGRLLLIPLPLQGHINPMLQLAQILHSNGFSITIIHTQFNSPNPSHYPHFTFCSFHDTLSSLSSPSSDLINFLAHLNTHSVEPFKSCLTTLLSHDEPIHCLISDAMCFFTQAVATSFGLPRIVLRTSSISSFLVFSSFPLLIQKRYLTDSQCEGDKLEEEVAEVPPLRVKDLPVVSTNNPNQFYDVVQTFVNETLASNGVIWNSFEALESTALENLSQQFSTPMYPIGPFHKHLQLTINSVSSTEQKSCISWLDQQSPKSVVYVSFGSIAAIGECEFLEIAFGLANSGHPFLWVVRPGMIRGWDWVEPLPSGFMEGLGGKGLIVKWAPQVEVLGHPSVGAFWSHNGWNSTMESISEGVPMICMPCFTDQNVNARYVSHVWKVGLHLEKKVERGEIERTISKIMGGGKEGKEIRERASILKQQAQLCLQQGGSSHHSLQRLLDHIMALNYTPPSHLASNDSLTTSTVS